MSTEPTNTHIKIINKRIKFHQGIALEPGEYHIKVSARALNMEYKTQKIWVTIVGGVEKIITMRLSPKSLQQVIGKPTKQSGLDWDTPIAISEYNKFLSETLEIIPDEFLILKGRDALGITKEAKILLNDKIQEHDAELKNDYQRRYFRYMAHSAVERDLRLIRLHEIRENPDEFQEASIWRSNRIGFRLAMDR